MTTLQDNTDDTPPLKRHPALQPLSREHFNGLRIARRLAQTADADLAERQLAVGEFETAWNDEIAAHFDDEERLLSDLASADDARRLRQEHEQLRTLVDALRKSRSSPAPDVMRRLGSLLHDHIRWEERQLFPRIQETATPEQFERLIAAAEEIETVRPGSRRRQSTRTP